MAFIPIERTSCLDSAINIDRLSGAMFTQENEAHQFVITCTQNNAQLTLTGTITAKVVLANGNTVELVGTIDGGKAVVTLTQPCYNTAGRIQISIFNTVGSTKLCIYAAIAYVQTAEHGDLIDGSQIIDSVEDLIADIQAAVATIPPDYSTLSNQVADLKSALNGTEEKTQIQYEYNNAYYDLSGDSVNFSVRGSSEFFHCALIPCQKDDKFIINVVGGNASRAYGFVKADGTIIQPVAPAGTTYTNESIVAPTGAAYLILNDRKSGGESYKVKTLADRLNDLEAIATPNGNEIACYGDSLTYGYMASSASNRYPSILAELTDMMVRNYGISGEASDQILARQMGYPAWVNDMTIPSGQTAVEMNWYANSMRSQSKTVKTIIGSNSPISTINPVTIAGVTGNLSYTNGTVYFTRAESGSAVAITRPVPVVVNNALDARNLIQIYWVGTNGGWFTSADDTQTRINKLLDQIDAMIRYNKTGKYLVLGLTYYYDFVTSTGLTPDQLDYVMQLRYGNNFVNVRRYMMEFGLSDANITPTQSDTTAIAEGKVPPSLLASDGIHGTDAFYSIVAHIVYERGKQLNYWE